MLILQWNAICLLANGEECIGFINEMENKPDVICIEETWLKSSIDFVIQGYVSVCRDRGDNKGGGCATFIKQGIPYREIAKGK